MRVLVVEDDRALGGFLKKGLMLEGHEVDWVGDGQTALDLLAVQLPDLIVLDLSLPRRDGMEVLEALRGRLEDTAVLVLTGRSQVEERIRCLNLGADDCLLKPFSFHELSARCRAILRRRERFANPVLASAGLEMDRMQRTVRLEGMALELTMREFALLESLLLHRGVCRSRAELLAEVWQSVPAEPAKISPNTMPNVTPNVVDVYITYLRRKLCALDPAAGSRIETVRGAGYRLRPPREPVAATTSLLLVVPKAA